MHRIQLEAGRIIARVMRSGRNLNQELNESLRRHPHYTAQERGALQDLSYGTLRHYARCDFMLDSLLQRKVHELTLRDLMRVALYQLQHSKVGQYVVVDQAVRASKLINPAASGLVNAVLRNFLRQQAALEQAADHQDSSHYSYSQWWIDTLRLQYGAQAAAIMQAGNLHPPLTLRVNVRCTDMSVYQALLAEQGFTARAVGPTALLLHHPVPVDRLPGFAQGWVSVQDAAAQHAARFLDVQTGMRVLDACAAPGGKTTHLLEIADIDLLALDRDEARLNKVADNLRRLHLQATLCCGDAAQPESWWDGKPFERILADVPCSASGVVRRHPDIKWLRRPQDIEHFAQQQQAILKTLWSLLARDGKLLYATCSIFARENQQVIAAFLDHNHDAVRMELSATDMTAGQFLPNEEHDGFFYALLHKKA